MGSWSPVAGWGGIKLSTEGLMQHGWGTARHGCSLERQVGQEQGPGPRQKAGRAESRESSGIVCGAL
jgi:hypothetical protein